MFGKIKNFIARNYILFFILILAFTLRELNIGFQIGSHPDERAVVMISEDVANGNLKPQNYHYGNLIYYTLAGFSVMFKSLSTYFYQLADSHQDISFLRTWAENFNFLGGYDGGFYIGRTLATLAGIITVLFVYLLATKIFNKKVGLISAFLLSINPFHISLSRYYTTDIFVTCAVTISAYLIYKAIFDKSVKSYYLSFVFLALGFAFKISTSYAIIPVLIMYGIFVKRKPSHTLYYTLLPIFIFFAIVIASEPYILSDYNRFWADNMSQVDMVRGNSLMPYTRQYLGTIPYLFHLEQMFFYTIRPLVFVLSILGMILICFSKNFSILKKLFLFLFVLPAFLQAGGSFVKFPRYLIMIYPYLMVFAGLSLSKINFKRSALNKILLSLLLFIPCIEGIDSISIYFKEHSYVGISRWIYKNIPRNSTILGVHWDDKVPLGLPGLEATMFGYKYHDGTYDLNLYEESNERNLDNFASVLEKGDYIALPSDRIIRGILDKFDQNRSYSIKLLEGLFDPAHPLGYRLIGVYKLKSFLGEAGLYDDSLADESLVGYDHPKTFVFQKIQRYSKDELKNIIVSIQEVPVLEKILLLPNYDFTSQDENVVKIDMDYENSEKINFVRQQQNAQPQKIGREARADEFKTLTQNTNFYNDNEAKHSSDNEDSFLNKVFSMNTFYAFIIWIFLLDILSIYILPFLYVVFKSLPDRGLGIFRIIGISVFAFIAWILGCVFKFEITQGLLIILLILLYFISWFFMRKKNILFQDLKVYFSKNALIIEFVYIAIFALFALYRFLHPEIIWGEKTMDFGFLNYFSRLSLLPPQDPWSVNNPLAYYFFGYFIFGLIHKISSFPTNFGFNLSIATIAAVLGTSLITVIFYLKNSLRSSIFFGLSILLLTNFEKFYVYFFDKHRVWELGFDLFWKTSRVHEYSSPAISEYPFWSLIFSDLHPHLMAMPIFVTVCLCLVYMVKEREVNKIFYFLISALSVTLFMTNTWDGITISFLVISFLLCFLISRTKNILPQIFWGGLAMLVCMLNISDMLCLAVFASIVFVYLISQIKNKRNAIFSVCMFLISIFIFYLPFMQGRLNFDGLTYDALMSYNYGFFKDMTSYRITFRAISIIFAFGIILINARNYIDFIKRLGIFTIISVIFVIPFYATCLTANESSFGWVQTSELHNIFHVIRHFGFWITCIIVGFLVNIKSVINDLKERCDKKSYLAYSILISVLFPIIFSCSSIFVSSDRMSWGIQIVTMILIFIAILNIRREKYFISSVFLLTFAVLLSFTELVFVIDRSNTIFKFYLGMWFFIGFACIPYIKDACKCDLYKWGFYTLFGVCFISSCISYVAMTRHSYVGDETIRPTLDGTKFLNSNYKDMLSMIKFINQEITGTPILLETYGEPYHTDTSIPYQKYTGLPILQGWDHHTSQRGTSREDMQIKKTAIDEVYNFNNIDRTKEILEKYGVSLIVVGHKELAKYPKENLAKFDEYPEIFKKIKSFGDEKLYIVNTNKAF